MEEVEEVWLYSQMSIGNMWGAGIWLIVVNFYSFKKKKKKKKKKEFLDNRHKLLYLKNVLH